LAAVASFFAMSGVIESLERAQFKRVPDFQAGDRVKVHFQVVEGTRRRTQVFEGTVLKRQGTGVRETFTVRKQSFGVGVERTFPVHSPKIERIEVASRGDVRRAKLYYLRGRVGRRARVRERQFTGPVSEVVIEAPEAFDASGSQDEASVLPGGAASEEGATEEGATEEAASEGAAAAETGAAETAGEGEETAAAETEPAPEAAEATEPEGEGEEPVEAGDDGPAEPEADQAEAGVAQEGEEPKAAGEDAGESES
jgi:large subunit ribosomal protein L19